jgi:rhodanese-related sulfurtransferase/biotin operon repressor
MSDREAKDRLFAEFAVVGKALGHPKRLELLDLLAQSPRSVDDLAAAAGLGTTTCSAHLQALREAGVLTSRRDGKRHVYALAGDDVAGLWNVLRRVAQAHRPHVELAREAYLGPGDTEAVDTRELLRRQEAGEIVVIDVRPLPEYEAGHLPGAVHLPLDELAERLGELPRGREVVAYCRGRYCVLAHDAVRTLAARGVRARRATDGALEWRLAGRLTQAVGQH